MDKIKFNFQAKNKPERGSQDKEKGSKDKARGNNRSAKGSRELTNSHNREITNSNNRELTTSSQGEDKEEKEGKRDGKSKPSGRVSATGGPKRIYILREGNATPSVIESTF